MSQKEMELIQRSFIDGQIINMTEQIDDYGADEFFKDYKYYLDEILLENNRYDYYSEVVISYHLIKKKEIN
jgi:hypothetical protein